MKRCLWALCLVAAASWTAPARAERVLWLGPGREPSAVVDGAGRLQVVWRDPAAARTPVRYCRIPVGGRGCTPVTIADEAALPPQLLLRRRDGALVVVYSRADDTTMALWSTDGGATWSSPTAVGTGLVGLRDAELTADGSGVDTVGDAVGRVSFQRVSLGGGTESRVVQLGPDRSVRAARVTHLPDGRPVVVAHYALHRLGARAPNPGADPDDRAAWKPFTRWSQLTRADAGDGASSRGGTWLATVMERTVPGYRVRVWRWAGRGFVPPPGPLGRSGGAIGFAYPSPEGIAVDVDPAGRLDVAWLMSPTSCHGQFCLGYRRGGPHGFGALSVYPIGHSPTEHVRIAAGPRGGWLVWDTPLGQVHASALAGTATTRK